MLSVYLLRRRTQASPRAGLNFSAEIFLAKAPSKTTNVNTENDDLSSAIPQTTGTSAPTHGTISALKFALQYAKPYQISFDQKNSFSQFPISEHIELDGRRLGLSSCIKNEGAAGTAQYVSGASLQYVNPSSSTARLYQKRDIIRNSTRQTRTPFVRLGIQNIVWPEDFFRMRGAIQIFRRLPLLEFCMRQVG